MYYCYILRNNDEKYKNYTYVGCTNNPLQRIRQHNQEISGGAKYTSSKGNLWEIIVLFEGFNNYKDALAYRLEFMNNTIDYYYHYGFHMGLKWCFGLCNDFELLNIELTNL